MRTVLALSLAAFALAVPVAQPQGPPCRPGIITGDVGG